MSDRIRLWSNGFEFDCFEEKNCDRCVKGFNNPENDPTCDLFDAVIEAMATDGTFAPEIVARFGWKEEYRAVLGWPCKEFQGEGKVEPAPAAHEMAKAGAAPLPGFVAPSPAAPGPERVEAGR